LLYNGRNPFGSGDCPNRVVDIRGDTIITFDIPFLFRYFYKSTGKLTLEDDVKMRIDVMGAIQGQVPTPSINMAIWRSAGPDMEFGQLVSRQTLSGEERRLARPRVYKPPVLQMQAKSGESRKKGKKAKTIATQQMNPEEEFARKEIRSFIDGTYYTKEEGICMTDKVYTLNDAYKRCVSHMAGGVESEVIRPNPSEYGAFCSLGAMYKFYRGGIRAMWLTNGDDTWTTQDATIVSMVPLGAGVPDFGNGGTFTIPYLNPIGNILVPWYNKLPYVTILDDIASPAASAEPRPGTISYSNIHSGTLADNPNLFLSGGEDFQYVYLCAPELNPS